ncbi:DNA repair protein RecO [Thermovibrio sp.]
MKTKGIVLKSKLLGDGLRALSLYTDKLGRLNAVVKVQRGEFPLKYEPFSISEFTLSQKGERFEVINSKLLKENFPKNSKELEYRAKISRLLIPLPIPANLKLFNLIESYLKVEKEFELAFTMFTAKFLFVEGLFPELRRCISCKSKEIVGFSLKEGGTVCRKCVKEEVIPWNRELSALTVRLTKEPFRKMAEKVEKGKLKKIKELLLKHYEKRIALE